MDTQNCRRSYPGVTFSCPVIVSNYAINFQGVHVAVTHYVRQLHDCQKREIRAVKRQTHFRCKVRSTETMILQNSTTKNSIFDISLTHFDMFLAWIFGASTLNARNNQNPRHVCRSMTSPCTASEVSCTFAKFLWRKKAWRKFPPKIRVDKNSSKFFWFGKDT